MALNYLLKNYKYIVGTFIFIFLNTDLLANLANMTRNDPFPLFSSIYPYTYLSRHQREGLALFDYSYPATKLRMSVSGYRQYASFARDKNGNVMNLGDNPRGRWNMLGLFYDPVLRDKLFTLLDINDTLLPSYDCHSNLDANVQCYCFITDPNFSDPNKEFGFFTIPAIYRKYGIRFENELVLVDRCFYSIGLKIQFGVADIKQMPFRFSDLTCQALGIACPANTTVINTAGCATPGPAEPAAVNPTFIAGTTAIPPCPTTNGPVTSSPCVPLPQRFTPCCDSRVCLSFTPECKKIVIEDIMRQKNIITRFLGIDSLVYDHVGVEDFRISLFWRHIFVINQEDERYPRLLFTPFIEAGAALPLDIQVKTDRFFGLPVGNNSHLSTGVTFGGTLDFLDSMELIFQVGFTKFFERDYCHYRLPTHVKESGIFPYTADIKKTPGSTWFTGFGINADSFIDNLSVWLEYLIIKHEEDDIRICKSYIPSTSIYYNQGFLKEYYEQETKWGAQVVNAGFNYDIAPTLSVGILWQVAARQRNAFQSSTFLGTFTLVY
ncbi:hypothetical protein [Candidatus Babela massiliensis]|uniref:Uncharacterized protein n=1 Tax=Candidatus Babela massiliensis TaxID=673862 RepID=V6DIM9_9BACT|nr:hypothetical protein [Candidatus Babela massiliensis]CDK30381.1 hypothetical protein BABL1_gene_646 [Candidatus Babela massiliensis]